MNRQQNNFTLNSFRPSSSPIANFEDNKQKEKLSGFTSALVTPQCFCAGYSAGEQKGFTLIELLVVVLIIGILAAIAVPQYQKAVGKSRLSQALILANNLEKGLTLEILTNGFPTNSSVFESYKDFDMELPQGIPCSIAMPNGTLIDKFLYATNIYPGGARYEVYRTTSNSCTAMTFPYTLAGSYSNGSWTHSCTSTNDIGKAMCDSLKSQGWY